MKTIDKLKTFNGYTSVEEVNSDLESLDKEINDLLALVAIQSERIDNLKKSNDFYSDERNWTIDGHTHEEEVYHIREHGEFSVTIREDIDPSYRYGGKLARECELKDQEIQKRLSELLKSKEGKDK